MITIAKTYPAYVEYMRSIGKHPVASPVFTKAMLRLFWLIARSMIVDTYEWKIPGGGGYMRVAKKRCEETKKVPAWLKGKIKGLTYRELTNGWCFFFVWDKFNSYCKIKGKRYLLFKPCHDTPNKMVGIRGLSAHVMHCARDPFTPAYDVVNKRHTKRLL